MSMFGVVKKLVRIQFIYKNINILKKKKIFTTCLNQQHNYFLDLKDFGIQKFQIFYENIVVAYN